MAEASGTANYYVGDIYINNEPSTLLSDYQLQHGKNAYLTVIHEIGHAMGLDHPFDETANWSTKDITKAFPETVMSYFWYKGEKVNEKFLPLENYSDANGTIGYAPQGFMIDDISALQWMYGVNEQFNMTDNVYNAANLTKVESSD